MEWLRRRMRAATVRTCPRCVLELIDANARYSYVCVPPYICGVLKKSGFEVFKTRHYSDHTHTHIHAHTHTHTSTSPPPHTDRDREGRTSRRARTNVCTHTSTRCHAQAFTKTPTHPHTHTHTHTHLENFRRPLLCLRQTITMSCQPTINHRKRHRK